MSIVYIVIIFWAQHSSGLRVNSIILLAFLPNRPMGFVGRSQMHLCSRIIRQSIQSVRISLIALVAALACIVVTRLWKRTCVLQTIFTAIWSLLFLLGGRWLFVSILFAFGIILHMATWGSHLPNEPLQCSSLSGLFKQLITCNTKVLVTRMFIELFSSKVGNTQTSELLRGSKLD